MAGKTLLSLHVVGVVSISLYERKHHFFDRQGTPGWDYLLREKSLWSNSPMASLIDLS
jgi:hypothetical protein